MIKIYRKFLPVKGCPNLTRIVEKVNPEYARKRKKANKQAYKSRRINRLVAQQKRH